MYTVLSKRARITTSQKKWSIVAIEADQKAITKLTVNGYETDIMTLDGVTFKKVMKQYATLKSVFEDEKAYKFAFWIREKAL